MLVVILDNFNATSYERFRCCRRSIREERKNYAPDDTESVGHRLSSASVGHFPHERLMTDLYDDESLTFDNGAHPPSRLMPRSRFYCLDFIKWTSCESLSQWIAYSTRRLHELAPTR